MRSCMKQLVVICLTTALGFWSVSLVWADEGPPLGPRTLVVALDGTGDYVSLQEAVDAAKKGDTVLIITGKDRGKQGTVSRALPQVSKVVVEGLNIAKKHVRPQGQTRQGGVIEKAMPIHVSNTMLICTECG